MAIKQWLKTKLENRTYYKLQCLHNSLLSLPHLFYHILSVPQFISDYFKIKRQIQQQSEFSIDIIAPNLIDKKASGGVASGHYFHQDLLVASLIYKNNPSRHVDIGSSVSSFVAHVAVFRIIEIFDIRPMISKVPNIIFKQADMMHLDPDMINYCDSISSLHAIEHFGLGRYGDPIDINGHLKGLNAIYSILKAGGFFYFSVPIGNQRIDFNSHRVFGLSYLLGILQPQYQIVSFSYIDDLGDLHKNIILTDEMIKNSCSCFFGCGVFELKKM